MRVVEVDDGLHGDLSVAEELGELVEEHRSDPFDPDCSWGTTGQDEVGQVQVEGCRPLLRLRRLRDVLVNRPAASIVEEAWPPQWPGSGPVTGRRRPPPRRRPGRRRPWTARGTCRLPS